MSTERSQLHAVADEPFAGNGSEHDTSPGSQRAIAKQLKTMMSIVERSDQRSIDTQDMVRGLAGEVGKLRGDIQKRIPPYALWAFLALFTAAVVMQAWSLFGGGA